MANHEPSATSQTPEFGPRNIRLEVQDFGPVAQASVQLRPLTVFVGPSNTGKTYLALLIYALHYVFAGFTRLPLPAYRYMDFDMRPGYWKPMRTPRKALKKMREKLTQGRQVRLSELPDVVREELVSNINAPELFRSELVFLLWRCFDVNPYPHLIRQSSSNISSEFRVSLDVSDRSGKLWQSAMVSTKKETLGLQLQSTKGGDFSVDIDAQNILLQGNNGGTNSRRNDRLLQQLHLIERTEEIHPLAWHQLLMLLINPGAENQLCSDAFYLPAVRGGVMQSHRIIASALVGRSTHAGFERIPEIPTLPGAVADFMQTLILYDERQKNSRPAASEQIAKLAKDLEKNILSGDILIDRSTTVGYPEFVYCPQGTKQNIRLSRASSMVSELTPIVLLMRGRLKPGDTLIIEEPEAHLHPAAQTQMARTLAALVRAGVRVLVTTHSDWLLQEMANLVREGELRQAQEKDSEPDASSPWLDPEELGVWLFKDSQDGGGATVKEIPFDRVDGLEPKDYADVAETLYNDSAKLQNQLELIKSQGGVAK